MLPRRKRRRRCEHLASFEEGPFSAVIVVTGPSRPMAKGTEKHSPVLTSPLHQFSEFRRSLSKLIVCIVLPQFLLLFFAHEAKIHRKSPAPENVGLFLAGCFVQIISVGIRVRTTCHCITGINTTRCCCGSTSRIVGGTSSVGTTCHCITGVTTRCYCCTQSQTVAMNERVGRLAHRPKDEQFGRLSIWQKSQGGHRGGERFQLTSRRHWRRRLLLVRVHDVRIFSSTRCVSMDLEGRGEGHNSIQEQTARSLLFALLLVARVAIRRDRNSYY